MEAQLLTERVKQALGELLFDKIQLMVQAEVLAKKIEELTAPVNEKVDEQLEEIE